MNDLVDRLISNKTLSRDGFKALIDCHDSDTYILHKRAEEVRRRVYGNKIFFRGLIEFTSYCKNDCYYCGLRKSNANTDRYRLTKDQILDCCVAGHELGFRTFVLQGGEDPYYTDDILCDIVREIHGRYPDCAITMSIGERSYDSYKRLFDAGADRYLLRHETANEEHYRSLHPASLSLDRRKKCLDDLKKIGYQVGCGFMVGSPGQTLDHLVDDLIFIGDLDPEMVGIGPFIPHEDTPMKDEVTGSLRWTLNCLAILRLMKPNVNLPATTALATIDKRGYELGIRAGANVVMPNLSPKDVRKKYFLYNNKFSLGDVGSEALDNITCMLNNIDCVTVKERGDIIEL